MSDVITTGTKKRKREVYVMEKNPRGKCIIINNISFDHRRDKRTGADVDAEKMKSLFEKLHFKVTVYTDIKAEDMQLVFARAKKPEEQKDADCLVVILMSHGASGRITSKDGESVNLSHGVYGWFNKDMCPDLAGKPKLFFIQACRKCSECPRPADPGSAGPSVPRSRNTRRERRQSLCFHVDHGEKTSSVWTDMYYAYATLPGYAAKRNRVEGSRFFVAVDRVFRQFSHTDSLDDLMNEVAMEMDKPYDDASQEQTPSVVKNGWRKRLYFNA